MKRIITIAAIAIAVALPATMRAQLGPDGYYHYNYTTSTRIMEILVDNINDGYITFDTDANRTEFLQNVQRLYNNRNAGNWSGCVAIANTLATIASDHIQNANKAYNANQACLMVAEIYGAGPYAITDVAILPEDEEDILLGWKWGPDEYGYRFGQWFIGFWHELDCTWIFGIKINF